MQVTNLLFEEFYNLITAKAKVETLLKLLDKPPLTLNDNIKESFLTYCTTSYKFTQEKEKEKHTLQESTPQNEMNEMNETQESREEKFKTLVDSLFDSDIELYKEQKRNDLLNSQQPVEYIKPKNDNSEYDKIENLPSIDTPTEEKNSFYKNKATRVFSKMTIQKRNETTQRLLNDAIKMIKKEDLPEDQENIDKYFEIRLRMFLDTFVN